MYTSVIGLRYSVLCTSVCADEDPRMTSSPGEFELRLSQLPPWAQKQVLSRPSMAKNVCSVDPSEPKSTSIEAGVGKAPAPLEGKWAEVCVCVCVCVCVHVHAHDCMCGCVHDDCTVHPDLIIILFHLPQRVEGDIMFASQEAAGMRII